MGSKRSIFIVGLIGVALITACGGGKYRSSKNLLGVVELGPFPKAPFGVAGYSLYMAEKKEGPFKRINTEIMLPMTNIMIPYMNPGQEYYFKMSAITIKPKREGPQGQVFSRKAAASKR